MSKRRLGAMLIALTGCVIPGAVAAQPFATFELQFESSWSAESHPRDFPRNPHFSGLIGAVHRSDHHLWQLGALASPGIRAMAELGAKSPLDDEITAGIAAGWASELVSGSGIANSPGSTGVTFEALATHSTLSLVSMVAPSPDWFVGVDALELRPNGAWLDEIIVDLFAYDAGTDSGVTYRSLNERTEPPHPITRIQDPPLGGQIPLGTFTIRRAGPIATPLELQSGRFLVRAFYDTGSQRGVGQPLRLTEDSGTFWFFLAENVELVVKVIDACTLSDHFWVFAGGLTNVAVELVVEDTVTGQERTYSNSLDVPFAPIQDTRAFATCSG